MFYKITFHIFGYVTNPNARLFIEKHQDKLLFASNCTDIIGQINNCFGAKIIVEIPKLAPDKKVERKILYHNAKKLFRL